MRIVLLGPPGSGKGTISMLIANKYGIAQISTGLILRKIVQKNKTLGKEIKHIINSGKLISDSLIITLVEKRIQEQDCQNGFLLDGFPRTILQANALKNFKIKIDTVLELYISNSMILKRISGRLVHESSGRIYHSIFNPPKIKGKDDVTGENLTVRKDDQKNILFERLKEYNNIKKKLIAFYHQEALLKNIKYYKLNTMQSIDRIKEHLKKIFS